MQAATANTHDILKDESRGSSSFRLGNLSRVLVMAEMALSVGLLVGAGLMIKSVVKLETIDLGFDARHTLNARMIMSDTIYNDRERRLRLATDLLTRVSAMPGVTAATLTTSAPGMGGGSNLFALEGVTYATDRDYPSAPGATIAPGFFATLGFRVIGGREFTADDRDGTLPVVVVNQSFERRWFPGQSALGKRLRFGTNIAGNPNPWMTIVGVVPDLYVTAVDEQVHEGLYRPIAQAGPRGLTVLALTRAKPASLVNALRGVVADVDPNLALDQLGSLEEVIQQENWYYAVFGALFVAFGGAALFLASIGLYGVMSFAVSRRRREMGVRMAVGADARDVVRLVLRQGMTQTAIGLIVGTAFALFVSKLLAAILFQVQPRDPVIFASIIAVLLLTAVLACWIPALRAARVDPLEALRYE